MLICEFPFGPKVCLKYQSAAYACEAREAEYLLSLPVAEPPGLLEQLLSCNLAK